MVSRLHPAWLRAILADTKPPPKIFAWSPANLDPASLPSARKAAVPTGGQTNLDGRIFIVGVGNIGRLFATHLARHPSPSPITLVVHRKELLSQWMAGEGVELTHRGSGKTIKNKDFDIEWWSEMRPQHGPVREVADGGKLLNVFISTKATAALPEADRLRRYLGKSTSVVFAQNGMSKLWPPHGPLYVAGRYQADDTPNFSACVVNHGVLSTGNFQSIHTAPADASIGPVLWPSNLTSCAQRRLQNQSQQQSGPSCDDFFTRHITGTPLLDTKLVSSGELWLLQLEKLVMNAAINPLTALLRCKNGDLFTSHEQGDPLGRVLEKLVSETSAVLQGLVNHDISTNMLASYAQQFQRSGSESHDEPESLAKLRTALTDRFSQSNLKAKLYAFGLKVGENRSSMLQDAEARKETEIRDFNGWIVDMADFLGADLDVGVHRGLVEFVENRETLTRKELATRLLRSRID